MKSEKKTSLSLCVVVVFLAAAFNLPAAAAPDKDLFCIGLPDNSTAEFGIVKEKYPAYPKTYPTPVVFTVGKSKTSDWPYLHPSSHDAWAGSKGHTFTIKFTSDKAQSQPLYLKIGVLGIWEPSQITIKANDKQIASQRLPSEELSPNLVFHPEGSGKSFPLVFPVPENSIKAGENTIAITLDDGSWILYDYVQLSSSKDAPRISEEVVDLSKEFLAGPMAKVGDVVFAVRSLNGDGHWYANIGYYSEDRGRIAYGKGGRLCKLNVKTGKMTILVDDAAGAVRDPVVHYDGKQILFSYRKGGTDNYLLYLINSDGSGLKQLTHGDFDDFEPCWLPDGGIVFVTTRAKRWVNCWLTQVANIWRCDADGGNMRALSANLEQDNTPWVMHDGRIQYMRWEYVDRSQVDYHHLWTMYPDGTAQSVFFGNMHPGGVYIDSKPIPDSDDMVLINSPGHGGIEHEGFLATVSVKQGPDELSNLKNVSKQRGFRDPWAFSHDAFMAANGNKLMLVNGKGQSSALFTLPKEFGDGVWLHEPRPILSHPREPVIPMRTDLAKLTGRFLLDNMYHGRNMVDVKPGEIKRMMIVESLPKPINFTGGMDPLSYKGTFTLERSLGTVPVEADGSAYFEAPAVRSLFFVALDANGKAIKRMQSFTTVQPGETLGCIGCHEQRVTARSVASGSVSIAAKRAPSIIEPLKDLPELPDFARDIQPVLDNNCVKCHDYDKRSGGVILTGDHGPMFSHSYYTLTVWKQISDGRNYARSNYEPHKLGSGGSALVDKLDGKHHDVKASEREKAIVRLWLDLGAPYPGTYAALGCGSIGGYIQNNQVLNNDKDWAETKAAQPVFKDRCISCHDDKSHPVANTLSDEIGLSFWAPNMDDVKLKYSRHVVFNLSRPEKSLILLAPLARSAGGYGLCRPKDAGTNVDSTVFVSKDDPGYKLLLAMCDGGKRHLEEIKRFDMPGFKPRVEYVREMKRYKLLPESFDLEKDPINVNEMDRKYWDSFIYNPEAAMPKK